MKKKIKGIDDNKVSLSTLKNLKGTLNNRVREIYRQAYKEGFEDGKEIVTSGVVILSKEAYSDLCLRASGSNEKEVVVHCKDCKYWRYWSDGHHSFCQNSFGLYADTDEDDYCSYGERK